MNTLLAVTLLVLLSAGGKMPTQAPPQPTKDSPIVKITPVLFMDAIEPSLPFWVDRLGFTKTVEVPHGDKLGFVLLIKGNTEIMIQTRASVRDDNATVMDYTHATAGIYIEVSDFPDLLKRVEGFQVIMPQRDVFYGMREVSIKEPGGNIITFAAPIRK